MIRKRNNLSFQSIRVEQLESRVLLAGHSFAAASAFHAPPIVAVASQFQASLRNLAGVHSEAAHTVLGAQLSDTTTGATATVTFKTGTVHDETRTDLKVNVSGAAANSTVDVTLAGVVVGQITTDATGAGSLKLSSNPRNSTEQGLPADFPTDVAAGAKINVGDLAGTLSAHGRLEYGEHGQEHAHPRITSVLSTPLADATNTAGAGNVAYRTGTLNGAAFTELKVNVTGAAPSTTLDVAIDGTVVGQLSTDSTGAGTLVLSSNPKNANDQQLPVDFPTTVVAGSTVSVGTATGTLAIATDTEHGCHLHVASTITAAAQKVAASVNGSVSAGATALKNSVPSVLLRPVRRG